MSDVMSVHVTSGAWISGVSSGKSTWPNQRYRVAYSGCVGLPVHDPTCETSGVQSTTPALGSLVVETPFCDCEKFHGDEWICSTSDLSDEMRPCCCCVGGGGRGSGPGARPTIGLSVEPPIPRPTRGTLLEPEGAKGSDDTPPTGAPPKPMVFEKAGNGLSPDGRVEPSQFEMASTL